MVYNEELNPSVSTLSFWHTARNIYHMTIWSSKKVPSSKITGTGKSIWKYPPLSHIDAKVLLGYCFFFPLPFILKWFQVLKLHTHTLPWILLPPAIAMIGICKHTGHNQEITINELLVSNHWASTFSQLSQWSSLSGLGPMTCWLHYLPWWLSSFTS